MKTGIIILAAGSSSRLGRAKQLVEFQGKKLIELAIEAAHMSQATSYLVVLGSDSERIQAGLEGKNITVLVHEHWQEGMSSSMQAGLRCLIQEQDIDQVVVMLCDQPFVDAPYLDLLLSENATAEKGIVASSYSNTLGVPALFDRRYFEELLQLTGAEGAKKVIFNHPAEVHALDFPLGAVDLDTEEDVNQFLSLYPKKSPPNPS